MEAMNDWWLSFPLHESLNQDLAIRRFCPARLEQEQGGDWEEMSNVLHNDHIDNMIQLCSPNDHLGCSTTPCLAPSEVDEFVDSVINMDLYEDKESQAFHQFHGHEIIENLEETFSMAGDVFVDNDVSLMLDEEDQLGMQEDFVMVPSVKQVSHGVDQGLHLVHLLLACAEAVGCRDTQLAHSMLSQIWGSASTWGDSLQRVSHCFAGGLEARLSLLLNNVNANGTFFTNGSIHDHASLVTKEEKMEAFELLHQTTPYIAFGFLAANEAICEASQGHESLHIIDLGMEHTLQWVALIRALASREEGKKPKSIRLTGLIANNVKDLPNLEASLKRLADDASSSGVHLEFNMVSELITPPLLTRERLDLREGEALFVNSMMHLHKYVKESRGSLKAILQGIKKLAPTLLIVVEQDANHNGPFFLGRFLESLHYYSAIFDSLEASLPRTSLQRMKIERHHYAEEIRNIIAFEGSNRVERHERVDQWRRQLGRAGFQGMGLSCMNQAKVMVSRYGCDGYTIGSEKGCLLLGWKGRPIMFASTWQVHNVSSNS